MLTYGLSGTVFSQIYSGFFAKILDAQSATSAFLLFLAVFVGVVNGSASFFMAKADTDLKEIVLMEPQIEKQKEDSSLHSSSSSPSTPCNNYITNEFTSSRQMLTSVVFYVYIMIFIWQQGSAYINNLSSIVTSSQTRPMDDDDLDRKVSLQLTLVSIFQAASRFIFAIVADFIGKLKSSSHSSVSRFVNGALLLIIAQLINLSPHLLLAFGGGNVSSLVLNSCSALIGLGYGMAGSLAAIVTRGISTFFFIETFSTNF